MTIGWLCGLMSLWQMPSVQAQNCTNYRLLVANYGNNTVTSYSTTAANTSAFINTLIPAPAGGLDLPNSLLLYQDKLYVANAGAAPDHIKEFDLTSTAGLVSTTTSRTLTASNLNFPEKMIVGPDGFLYVANFGLRTISKYNIVTGAFIASYTVTNPTSANHSLLGLAFVGTDLYVTEGLLNSNGGGRLIRISNLGAGTQTTVIAYPATQSPRGLTLGPDGNLYISSIIVSGGLTTSAVIDRVTPSSSAATLTQTRFVTGIPFVATRPPNPYQGLNFSPDGFLYVADFDNNIVRVYQNVGGVGVETTRSFSTGLSGPHYVQFYCPCAAEAVLAPASITACSTETSTVAVSTTGMTTPVSYTVSVGASSTVLTGQGTSLSFPVTSQTSTTFKVAAFDQIGCAAQATGNLTVNPTPVATISSPQGTGSSVCLAGGQAQLTGASTVNGSTYQWTGPGGYSATTQTITVSTPGTYTLIVSANGCASDPVTVTVNQTPTLTLANNGPITCAQPTATLSASISTFGSSYSYRFSTNGTTVSGQTAATQSAIVNQAGTYSLTVTSASGCTAVASTVVTANTTVPTVSVSNTGPLSCTLTSVTLSSTATAGVSYRWSNGATTATTTASTAGTYSLTVTSANGCSAVASTTVTSDVASPTVAVSNTGPLSCTLTSVTLSSTATAGVSYRWSTGATTATTNVNQAGTYSLTVTSANGCSAVASTTVTSDVASPTVAVSNNGPLSCTLTSVTLSSTATAGVSYRWSNGATTATTTASTAGTYSLTVTSANGCTTVASTTVTSDVASPTVAVSNTGPLSCTLTSVTLSSTATAGVSYRWSNGATTATTNVNQAGTYSLTVTSANGCSAVASTTVTSDVASPTVAVSNTGPLSCTLTSVTLSSTATAGVSYRWSNGATTATTTASTAGTYSLTVTSANGCTAVASTTVTSDVASPTVSVSNTGPLSCTLTSVTLSSTATAGVSYRWNNGATTATTTASTADTYSLTVTSANGCSAVASTTVTSDVASPTVAVSNNGPLSCTLTSVTLSSTATAGVSYRWSTGATTATTNVNQAGTYSLTVTSANGCSAVASTTVTSDVAAPTASINSLTLTTAAPTGTLTASASNAASPVYLWSTGATTASISVSAAGPYSVTVTSSNGCSAVASTTVMADMAPPVVTINSLTLTCSEPTGTLTASVSNATNPTYLWSTGATTASISVSAAGPYSVTVTGGNGSRSVATTAVISNTATPTVALNDLTLTCAQPGGTLTASASNATNPMYLWNTGATTTSINVSVAGPYSVTVTSTNGCSTVGLVTVEQQKTAPDLIAAGSTVCAGQSLTLTASSSVPNATYQWQAPDGFTASTALVTIANATTANTGVYTVVVTNPATGCFSTTSVMGTVEPAPDSFSLVAREATCTGATSAADGQVQVLGTVSGQTFEVSTTGQFTGAGQPVPADGVVVRNISRTGTSQTYTVRVYNASGCFADQSVVLFNAPCDCPSPVKCVPFVITKARR